MQIEVNMTSGIMAIGDQPWFNYLLQWVALQKELVESQVEASNNTVSQSLPPLRRQSDKQSKITIWNVRGAANEQFIQYFGELRTRHEPFIFIMLETQLDRNLLL